MAGDWIKMRGNLWDDPRVAKIVDMTESSEAAVIGALYWLWATADQHTEDGVMPGLTLRSIDRKAGVKGFAEAMCFIEWLADHPEGVRIIDFEKHNGSSAKKRCQTAKRVANHATANATQTHQGEQANADSVSAALAREEKRREEKNTSSLRSEVSREKKHRESQIVSETLPIPTQLDRQTWRDWVSFRSSIKKPLKHETAEKQIQFLCESIASGHDPVAIINESIRNGWTGLFAKDHHRSQQQRAQPKTFAERDREAGWARWEEQTGRIHPDRPKAHQGSVIDVTPNQFLENGQ